MDATILEPIPGSNPSGPNIRYEPIYSEIRARIRVARGEVLSDSSRLDFRGDSAQWGIVISASIYVLKQRSKDLMIAAWLTEAWLARDGFSGMQKGLDVLGGLLEKFWETLYPEIDDGDFEARRMVLEWVNTHLAAAVSTSKVNVGRPSPKDASGSIAQEAASETEMLARIAACRQRVRDLVACRDSLQALDDAWREKSGEFSPVFPDLRQATLQAMREAFFDLIWQLKKRFPKTADTLSGEFRDWLSKERIEELLQRLDDPKQAFQADSVAEIEERCHASELAPAPRFSAPTESADKESPEERSLRGGQAKKGPSPELARAFDLDDFGSGQGQKRSDVPMLQSAPAPTEPADKDVFIRIRNLSEGKAKLGHVDSMPPGVPAPSEAVSQSPPWRYLNVSSGKGMRRSDDPPPPSAPAPAIPAPMVVVREQQNVDFTLTAPAAVTAGVPFELFVWAHELQERSKVLARAREELNVRDLLARSKGPFKVASGTMLSVRLVIPGSAIDEAEDAMVWEGESTCVSFVVMLPEASLETKWAGSAQIYANGVKVARISFVLSAEGVAETAGVRYKKAFASYASADRDAVLGRIQGIHKVAPELEIFLDVVSLRSGQNWESELWRVIPASDIFYLFWSTHARKSEWVEKEWRCALRERGIEFIDPIPLESPQEAPPPSELSSLHFSDWELAFMRVMAS